MLFWGIFRGAMLPVFLIYTFADIFQSDVFICVFIAFISILSGYLNTTCYAVRLSLVPLPSSCLLADLLSSLSLSLNSGQLVPFLPPHVPRQLES